MVRKCLLGLFGLVFVIFYTYFWTHIFIQVKLQRKLTHSFFLQKYNQVLGSFTKKENKLNNTQTEVADETTPQTYKTILTTRKQYYNLSCEFAAASSIIYHFTQKEEFNPNHEKTSEDTLITQISVSQNPDIGIRMGTTSTNELYTNLQKQFGGSIYYGVHAPPFIELFQNYDLQAIPLNKYDNIINTIKKALYKGHLIMVWLRIGQGSPIDTELAYGSTPLIPGEHVVTAYGYDTNGIWVMDPGSSQNRRISYNSFLASTLPFSLPFLEVKKLANKDEIQEYFSIPIDPLTKLDRRNITVLVENGSGKIGRGNEVATLLQEFGYTVLTLAKTNTFLEKNTVFLKEEKKDYTDLLKKDFGVISFFPQFVMSSESASLEADLHIVIVE